ncbi:MAG: nitroreductase family protein [Candidatus Syntrophosphaera sp.]|nr:nitroreductase family protein [Candidatus Syntrophosphaera sp.]
MKPRPEFTHPIHELLQKRWSPRAFSDRMLKEEQALTLFEAARWAASCNNEQPWRFIWSLRDGSEKYEKLFDCLMKGNQEWAASAPLLILALIQNHFSDSGKPNRWAAHDLGLAIGNLTTQATLMDLYVHNMAGFSREKAAEHFELPEGVEPLTMFVVGWLGDPAMLSEFNQKREAQIQDRKPLAELFL